MTSLDVHESLGTNRPLNAKTALVTGASKGIGRAIAERLGRDGALVAVHYGADLAGARETVARIEKDGGRAVPVGADLAAPDAVDTLFRGLDAALAAAGAGPELDIIVNNAGVGSSESLDAIIPEEFDRLFAVNVRAPLFLLQRALPRLRDGGRVVNISSGVTRIALPALLPYAMSKGALESLGHQLAQQLGPRGITVNSVAPGIVDTASNAVLRDGDPATAQWAADVAALKRIGLPEDIADVVGFLASADGRWVTGQRLDATGGAHL